ncbi:hypothetical protein QQS21_012732 [Conoideocrella luteorostrata]|uniref:Uncharacterized protein n=1 Tax=Conoideocrella luteorostrata TaxID=1105319 RepID=A0AAJ0FS74_9HYPO|nr:hypothetical protein QQS21_012732 [Conoideocrella luteorostrata]
MRYREENGRTYHAFRAGSMQKRSHSPRQAAIFIVGATNIATTKDTFYQTMRHATKALLMLWFRLIPSQVTGVDLSPIQPSVVPPNVSFYVDDIEDEWTFSLNFDFIYSRMLTASISDWPEFIQQSYSTSHLNPGGWMEIADILLEFRSDDGTIPPDCAASKWGDLMLEAAARLNRPLDSCKRLQQQMQDAGFTNIVETIYKWPSNPWPRDRKFKEMGKWDAKLGKNEKNWDRADILG